MTNHEPPHLLLVTPGNTAALRGNATHARRFIGLLHERGWQVSEVGALDCEQWAPMVSGRLPDLVLALHAWRCGPAAAACAVRLGCPLVIATTGTDVEPGLDTPDQLPAIETALRACALAIVQHEGHRQRLHERLPALEPPVVKLNPGVSPGLVLPPGSAERRRVRDALGLHPERPLVVLVSGLREIKGVLEACTLMDALHEHLPSVHFLICGAAVERDYALCVEAWRAERSWALRRDGLAEAEMLALNACADLVINTSWSEGLSNALLEAMASATPVLAADILSNRALIQHQRNGLLYPAFRGAAPASAQQAFVDAALQVLTDPHERARLAASGRSFVLEHHSLQAEGDELDRLLRAVVSATEGRPH